MKEKYQFQPTTKTELINLIDYEIQKHGRRCSLNHIDVSLVSDMSSLFDLSCFNGDISQWDVSHVTNMKNMFANSDFNHNISQWDVSNVINMNSMFLHSKFNGDISRWNVASLKDMSRMFETSEFAGSVEKWKPYHLISHDRAFLNARMQKPYWANLNIEYLNKYLIFQDMINELPKDKPHPQERKQIKI